MNYEVYADITFSSDLSLFEFESIGKYGSIYKRVAFVAMALPDVYNMVFGDISYDEGIDDFSISDNGDRNKILATLASIVERYAERYPDRWIYFCGNTEGRTRLYRMAIGLNLDELSEKFEIYAEVGDKLEVVQFQKNMCVNAFLIKRKK